MLSIVVIVVSLVFIVLAATSFRRAALFFVFMLPFTPRYLAIGVGSESLPLSLRRIMLAVLVVSVIWSLATGSRRAWMAMAAAKTVRIFLLIVFLLFLSKFVSTALNQFVQGLPYFLENFLYAAMATYIALYVLSYEDGVRALIRVIAASLLMTLALAVIERGLGHPLLQGITQVEVYIRLKNPLAGHYRSGYRVQSGFGNPLLLAEFISIVIWPCVALFWKVNRRKIWLSVPLLAALVLVFTGSRSGIVVPLFVIAVGAVVIIGRSLAQGTRPAMWLFVAIIAPLLGYVLFTEILVPAFVLLNPATSAGSRSVYARIMQYLDVWNLVQRKPFLGYGMRQIYSTQLQDLSTLDNYYLALLLQGGIPACVFGLLSKLYAAGALFGSAVRFKREPIFLGLASAVLASSVYELFVSLPTNHAYFYLFATIGMAMYARHKNALHKQRGKVALQARPDTSLLANATSE